MAKYLILIYGPESATLPTPDQWDQMMQAHGRFAQAVDQQGGKTLGGEALQPTATATSVRYDGQTVTDGPFVDTKPGLPAPPGPPAGAHGPQGHPGTRRRYLTAGRMTPYGKPEPSHFHLGASRLRAA
jgi:hypothetical protein